MIALDHRFIFTIKCLENPLYMGKLYSETAQNSFVTVSVRTQRRKKHYQQVNIVSSPGKLVIHQSGEIGS